ncbi:MAG: hypothetical protein ACOWWR_12225 [Eubacteriales bacterium]
MVTRRNQRRPNTVERKVYFYRIVAMNREQKLKFNDLVKAAEEINTLDWDTDERYMDIADGDCVCAWCDQIRPQIRMKLGIKRKNALPDIEDSGNLTPLNIADTAGLSELTHIVIFPSGIVGVEFNFYGPRIQRLKHYLEMKTGINSIDLQMLLQHDVEHALEKFRNISILHFRLKRSDATLLSEADAGGLGAGFDAIVEQLQAPLIEVVLRNPKHSKMPLPNSFLHLAKMLAKHAKTRETFDILKIKGYNENTYRSEELDLLRDALISSQSVVKQGPRSRSLNSQSVYEAINGAYMQLKEDIGQAAALE